MPTMYVLPSNSLDWQMFCAVSSFVYLYCRHERQKAEGDWEESVTELPGVGSREAYVPLVKFESNSFLPNPSCLLDQLYSQSAASQKELTSLKDFRHCSGKMLSSSAIGETKSGVTISAT